MSQTDVAYQTPDNNMHTDMKRKWARPRFTEIEVEQRTKRSIFNYSDGHISAS